MDSCDNKTLKSVKKHILSLYNERYKEMNDCNYWGDAVKNEDDKKNVTLKIIRLGLYGSLYDLGNIPTIETFHHWLSQAEKTVTHHKREEITPDENEENDG